jgi:acyl-CoA synthetase (AMP-forming)/AMP-acid ligase II
MNALRTYKGKKFISQNLPYLKGSLVESYTLAVKKNSQKMFIKSYEDSLIIAKTFAEFDEDVSTAAAAIAKHNPAATTFILITKNSYLSAVYIAAAIFSGLTICLINPEEEAIRIKQKISMVKGKKAVWTHPDFKTIVKARSLYLKKSLQKRKLKRFLKNRPAAYVFTSGSTGYSKIVEQMEQNILSNVDAVICHHGLNLHPRTIATSLPIFHVNTLWFSFCAALLSGSSLILYDQFKPKTLFESLSADRVEVLSLVPTLFHILLKFKRDFLSTDLSRLKYFVTAAAPLSVNMAKDVIAAYGKPIVQGYGLSEAVNFSAILPVDLPIEENRFWLTNYKHPSIGVALPGNEIHICNDNFTPCREGEEGNLLIRGHSVMRSYSKVAPKKIFAYDYLETGDRGYFHKNSSGERYFFISGRSKDVIKRNGMTISLREVDDLLFPLQKLCGDVIAVGFANDFSGEEIGVVVSEKKSPELIEKISHFLNQNFVDLLRPCVFVFTQDSLRTASGKPQRWKFQPKFDSLKSEILSQRIRCL